MAINVGFPRDNSIGWAEGGSVEGAIQQMEYYYRSPQLDTQIKLRDSIARRTYSGLQLRRYGSVRLVRQQILDVSRTRWIFTETESAAHSRHSAAVLDEQFDIC